MSDAEGTPPEETGGGGGSDIGDMIGSLSGGERLAVLGAAGVLAIWLIFDLLWNEFGLSSFTFALAVVVVAAAYFHRQGSGGFAVPYTKILFVAAGLLGLLAAVDVVEELLDLIFDRGSVFDTDYNDGIQVLAAILYYAAAITSGAGARQLGSE